MGEPLILAVDIGTSSIRAALYSRSGGVRAYQQALQGVLRPEPFMEEQNPDEVRARVYSVIAACLEEAGGMRGDVRGMAFSSQMYSVFPVDAAGTPLANSILWSDGRAEDTAAALCGRLDAAGLYRETGCPLNSLYPFAKVAWLRDKRGDACRRAAKYVSIKDYVVFPLAGEWVADYSMASATGMFDLAGERWSDKALDALGLERDFLPALVAGWEALPFRNSGLLREWGLPENVALFLGGGDGPLANIGSGANGPGGVNIDLGTSGAVRAAVDRPMFEKNGRLWCYAMQPGRWAYGGIVTNVGNAMQWLGSALGQSAGAADAGDAAARIGALAEGVPAGSGGVVCLPYLRKARAPHWDERLRGGFLGLSACHDLRHLARAALEAIAFDLAAILDLAAAGTAAPERPVVLTGGISKNRAVPQLLANVLDRTVVTPDHCEGSMAGAAIVGLRGAGLISDFAFERERMETGTRYPPDPGEARLYRQLRDRYARLIDSLQRSDILDLVLQ